MQIKRKFIYVLCLFFTLSAYAVDQEYIRSKADRTIGMIDHYTGLKSKYPEQDHSRSFRETQLYIFNFNTLMTAGTATPATNRSHDEATMDFYNDECNRDKTSTYCGNLTKKLADYKKDYSADYKPKKPAYLDLKVDNYTYTFNGKSYDLKNLKFVDAPKGTTAGPTPAVSSPVSVSRTTTVSITATVSSTPAATTSDAYACEWDNALPPRKLLYAPGCSGADKVCSGYVKCTKNGYKINRLATCGSKYCSDSSATDCAKQKGYGSKTVNADGQAASSSSSGNKQNSGGGVN